MTNTNMKTFFGQTKQTIVAIEDLAVLSEIKQNQTNDDALSHHA